MNPISKASVIEKLANAVKTRIIHLQRKKYENKVSRSIPQYMLWEFRMYGVRRWDFDTSQAAHWAICEKYGKYGIFLPFFCLFS